MRQFLVPAMLCVAVVGLMLLPLARGDVSTYSDVLIKDVPHVQQKPDFCGEACIEMWTSSPHVKQPITQDQAFNASGVKPVEGRGCVTREMASVLKTLGFATGDTWYTYESRDAAKTEAALAAQFAALHADLKKGIPSIVCMHYDDKPKTTEHFRLILGYDARKDEVIYHEPAEAWEKGAYKRMAKATFLKLWPLQLDETRQAAIRMRLELPGKVKKIPAATGFTDADYAQHIMQLKQKMPKGFSYMIQRPFVIVSDESPEQMASHAERTVKWATEKLKADYFAKDPTDILDVWLFKDEKSYNKYTRDIFNHTPSTPYGYYSSTDKALVMNIATGGGTLVHEIVHPFIASNFPNCPSWFNEGLGSLYEQCREKNGHIMGSTNWRLTGLQRSIAAGKVPSFEKLCAMDSDTFYGENTGTHYAQARYLLYYLQEQGLLTRYYKEFTANAKENPTGFKTLKKILGEDDMDKFKEKWEKFVLALKFP